MKKVVFDFYNELGINSNNDVIVVRPEGFNMNNDTVEVRQYIVDTAIHHLIENGEITEGDFEVITDNHEREFNEFMNFIRSFKDGDHFAFHIDYSNEVQNIAIYRVGKKIKYSADYRFKEDGLWFLENEEEGVLTYAVIKWIESIFDAEYMKQGWCNVDCEIHF